MRSERLLKLLGVSVILLSAGTLLGCWLMSISLVSPPRRAIQDYHMEWLSHPSAHGMKIQAFSCLAGQTACLLAEPDGAVGPGGRGKILRAQLVENGYTLDEYGVISGVLVLLHGRNGRKEDLLPVAERFAAAGFRCLIPDLPAHGESALKTVAFAATESEGLLAAKVLQETRLRFGLPDEPAALWGMSMGGAFAVKAAAIASQQWRALVIVSSFPELKPVVERQLASWLGPLASPAAVLIEKLVVFHIGVKLSNIRPADWAKQVHIPVLSAHGDQDALIPIDEGYKLFARFASRRKKWTPTPGGDHKRVLVTPLPLYAIMSGWFLDWTRSPG